METPIRVFILHRHHLFTEVLAEALLRSGRIQVVGTAGELGDALRQLEALPADVVVVESDLDRGRLPAMIRDLRATLSVPRILPLGLEGDDEILACIEAGAAGYVRRRASVADLLEILERVHGGSAHCSAQLAASIVARIAELSYQPSAVLPSASEGTPPVTPRELEILKLIARGLRNQEIAEELGIALSTVKNHIHLMLRKLRVGNRREAIGRAWEIGLIDAVGR